MKLGFALLTYESDHGIRAGIRVDGRTYDAARCTRISADQSVLGILEDWDGARARLAKVAKSIGEHAANEVANPRIVEPIHFPGAIFCAGANYSDHVAEMAKAQNIAPEPDPRSLGLKSWHFLKPSRAVVGQGSTVQMPRASKKVDWEAELAVVIGRKGKDIPLADALSHVAGYTVANDLSARDLGNRAPVAQSSPFKYDWVAHKAFDGSCPLGPWIVPAEDIGDPQNLAIELRVNSVVKQSSNTAKMIFGIAEQIADLSEKCTLYPGDVILTGTPAGVGAGRGEFLKSGDRIDVRIEAIGELTTMIA